MVGVRAAQVRGHRAGWHAMLLAVVVLGAACGGPGSATTTSTSRPPTPSTRTTPTTGSGSGAPTDGAVTASASPGCAHLDKAAPGTTILTSSFGGVSRTAIVHVPTGYAPPRPVALVVNMHGSDSTAAQQEALTGMDATADADTFLVVYPQAVLRAARATTGTSPASPCSVARRCRPGPRTTSPSSGS